MFEREEIRPARVTSYNASGRPVARCNHPYWQDVNPIHDTFDREAHLRAEAKFASDYKALNAKLEGRRILYAIG